MFGRRYRWIDRRVAAAAIGLAVLVFVVVLATTSAPEPELARNDTRAAFELVTLLARGQKLDFLIESSFTRTRSNGLHLTATETEVRWGHSHLLEGGGSLEIDLPTKMYVCEEVGKGSSCLTQPPQGQSTTTAEAMVIALGTRAYDIVPVAGETIAGEPAKCFDVTRNENAQVIQGLGDETLLCTSSDGLVLRARVRSADGVDDQRAVRVQRKVDSATVEPLFAGFEAPPEKVHG
jgi:hypothetical protein